MERIDPAAEVEVRKSGLELRKKDAEVGRERRIPAGVGVGARVVVVWRRRLAVTGFRPLSLLV